MEGLNIWNCGFCGGVGHLPNKCSTKKKIDNFVKGNPKFKVLWGAFKGQVKFTKAQMRGAKQLKALVEEEKQGANDSGDGNNAGGSGSGGLGFGFGGRGGSGGTLTTDTTNLLGGGTANLQNVLLGGGNQMSDT